MESKQDSVQLHEVEERLMISRAQMGSQLKGNRMAKRSKKPTKKKVLGGLLTGDEKGIAEGQTGRRR